MKKLLFLGAYTHMIDAIITAKNMGIYTIAVDREIGSPAKAYADKSYDLDTSRIDELECIAREESINGVFNGFEDYNVWTALRLTKRLSLPFYATEKQLDTITNKNKFTEYCRRHDVPTVPEYKLSDVSNVDIYPLIIKPTDSYGSRGICIVRRSEDFKKALDYSKSNSKSGNTIIEPFIETDHGVELYYTIQDGRVYLTATTDRYTIAYNDTSTPLPYSTVYPSQHKEALIEQLDPMLRAMLCSMELKNGLVLIQCIYNHGEFFVYEMAYRLTGEHHYRLVYKQTGMNLMEMMIKLALNEDISKYDLSRYDNDCFINPACNLAIVLKPGRIKSIIGYSEIFKLDEVVSYVKTHYENDIVPASGNYAQILIRINLFADNLTKLCEAIEKINKLLIVTDESGNDMIISRFHLPFVNEE